MKKPFVKLQLVFIIMILAIMSLSQITYADVALSQSNVNIPSEWAKIHIEKAKGNNLIPETLQSRYRANITREEFCQVVINLYEALSGKEGILPEKNPFTDTKNTQILKAYQLGIVKGKGNGKFDPYNTITREEISVMLYQTLQIVRPGFNYQKSYDYIFSDTDIISLWARESVSYLYSFGVISGVGDNRFNPKGTTTREQAFVLAERMYENVLEIENALRSNSNVSRGGYNRQESNNKAKLASLISQEMGKPYQWGATGPSSYDCSGLIYSLYGKLGIELPRVSRDQATAGTYVSKENLTYGDLVFFARDGKNINHVGIYVGDGGFVHAPKAGEVVKISTLATGYYAKNYYTARRVLP
ncbi:putative lipoprotein yafL [Proteiniborus sp. DW1]|uniref:NlpC/P60 family protein n=1 Tax=Proteiniborus sp. DW1 TaxID=1889883 RepID=UPI00092DEDB0|nr:NlpC/P60 family protein [Proteiniborus sp. DW1]SCG84434.1 putative lipoprotein yafL [Proteiniborus sp. DW1]